MYLLTSVDKAVGKDDNLLADAIMRGYWLVFAAQIVLEKLTRELLLTQILHPLTNPGLLRFLCRVFELVYFFEVRGHIF